MYAMFDLIANKRADHQLLYYWIIFMLCFLYFLSSNNNRNQIYLAGRADNNVGRAGYLTYICRRPTSGLRAVRNPRKRNKALNCTHSVILRDGYLTYVRLYPSYRPSIFTSTENERILQN